jgi:hypothetical protein
MLKILILALLAGVLLTGAASAAQIGLGAYGGINVPVLNDLSKQGTDFGVRVPIKLADLFSVEPFFSMSSLGDVDESFGGPSSFTMNGGDPKASGANAMFTVGEGFKVFPFAGIGSYRLTRSGSDDVSDMGFQFGLGLGFLPDPAVERLSIDIRGEFDMMVTDQTSQKFAKATAGVSYLFFGD